MNLGAFGTFQEVLTQHVQRWRDLVNAGLPFGIGQSFLNADS